MARALGRFCAAVLIGVGLTLAWQTHAEQINEAVISWVPSEQSPKQPAEAAVSSEVTQQIKLIAVDLAIVRRKHRATRRQSGPVRRQARANESKHCDAAADRARRAAASFVAASAEGGASSSA
jgi:hypothetical protein